MAETPSLRQTIKGMADAIRAKGISGQMSLLQMPNKIGNISTGEMYGLSMDCLLGDVDSSGVLQAPSVASFTFTSNAIKILPNYALYYRFYQNTGITSLSLQNLTSVNQYSMYQMCYDCSNLTSVNLSSLTFIGINGIANAFRNCTSLTSADLSGLSSLTGINGMSGAFQNCTSLTNVDLSNLSSVTGSNAMGGTFTGCTSLRNVKLNKLSYVSSGYWGFMFNGCTALEKVDFSEAVAIPSLATSTFNNTRCLVQSMDCCHELEYIRKSNRQGFGIHMMSRRVST